MTYPCARYSAKILERGLSSCSTSWSAEPSFSAAFEVLEVVVPVEDAEVTWTWEGPSWVLSRRRAVFAAVSFSKVTVAD